MYNEKMQDKQGSSNVDFYNSMRKRWWARIIMWGFDLLYHQYSWIYDFAAWLVSAGKWNDWIRAAGWLVPKGPLLDMGCGKGILLQHAVERDIPAIGLDESPQMLRHSSRLLNERDLRLIRAVGQSIPIKSGVFQTVTATFPAPYIFEPATLNEIRRVLKPGGKMIILVTGEVTGSTLHEKIIRFAYGLFGFSRTPDSLQTYLQEPLRKCGFMGHVEWIAGPNARLLVIVAQPV